MLLEWSYVVIKYYVAYEAYQQAGLPHFKVGLVQHKQAGELVKACLAGPSI